MQFFSFKSVFVKYKLEQLLIVGQRPPYTHVCWEFYLRIEIGTGPRTPQHKWRSWYRKFAFFGNFILKKFFVFSVEDRLIQTDLHYGVNFRKFSNFIIRQSTKYRIVMANNRGSAALVGVCQDPHRQHQPQPRLYRRFVIKIGGNE